MSEGKWEEHVVQAQKPLEWLSEAMLTITTIPVLVMMAHVTLDVLLKYLFSMPIEATLEVTSYYYMVSIVVLPMAFVELTRQSIAVDLFYQMMGYKAQIVTTGAVLLLSAASYGLLAWISWPEAISAYEKKEIVMGTVNIYIWPARFLLPIALTVTTLVCLMHFVRLLTSQTARVELTALAEETSEVD